MAWTGRKQEKTYLDTKSQILRNTGKKTNRELQQGQKFNQTRWSSNILKIMPLKNHPNK